MADYRLLIDTVLDVECEGKRNGVKPMNLKRIGIATIIPCVAAALALVGAGTAQAAASCSGSFTSAKGTAKTLNEEFSWISHLTCSGLQREAIYMWVTDDLITGPLLPESDATENVSGPTSGTGTLDVNLAGGTLGPKQPPGTLDRITQNSTLTVAGNGPTQTVVLTWEKFVVTS